MASFEQHINVAVVSTGLIIVPLHSSGLLNVSESLIALSLGIFGTMLPDLDSNHSKPTQIVFKMSSIFLPLIVLLSIPNLLSIVSIVGIWVISSFLLHYIFFKTFLSITSHRGLFHSIPMGIFFAQLTIFIFYNFSGVDKTFSLFAGFFIFFGFMIHLILDELYSINLYGMEIKRSFGTALKLFDKNNMIGTVLLYALIGTMFYTISFDESLYIALYEDILKTLMNVKII
ncbi:MAG: metal-dependent hydrolase [Campylobacterota bacterium]|nr:metal-dependent hydrolase [Campylobacterota bacterium]